MGLDEDLRQEAERSNYGASCSKLSYFSLSVPISSSQRGFGGCHVPTDAQLDSHAAAAAAPAAAGAAAAAAAAAAALWSLWNKSQMPNEGQHRKSTTWLKAGPHQCAANGFSRRLHVAGTSHYS